MPRPEEDGRVEAWHLECLLELDFLPSQAENLVRVGVDWHEAETLLKAGMTHEQAYYQLVPPTD